MSERYELCIREREREGAEQQVERNVEKDKK